jgi:hypothetical protein
MGAAEAGTKALFVTNVDRSWPGCIALSLVIIGFVVAASMASSKAVDEDALVGGLPRDSRRRMESLSQVAMFNCTCCTYRVLASKRS